MTASSTSIFSLSGKEIWVFGDAGHLGQPIVSLLSASGASVLCVDLEDRVEAFVSAARLAASVTPATTNVRDVPARKQLVPEQIKQRGVPQGLVNLTFASTAKFRRSERLAMGSSVFVRL